jgi:hypothetical protein
LAEQNPAIFLQAGSHPAEDVRRFIASITNDSQGIVTAGSLVVTEKSGTPNMSVDVAGGRCFIKGTQATYQGTYFCEARGSENLTVSAQHATNNRIDRIVAKVEDAAYSGATNAWSLAVVTGTPAGSPSAPSAPANSITLALVTVRSTSNGGGSVLNADVADQRALIAFPGGVQVVTSGTRPTATDGVLIYETDTDRLMVYDGSAWEFVGGNRPSVQANRASSQSLTDSTATAIAFNAGDGFDTDSLHDTSSNNTRITIPAGYGGRWRFEGIVVFASATGGNRLISVRINGSSSHDLARIPPVSGAETIVPGTKVLNLASGDYVELLARQSSGGSINCSAAILTATYEGR